MLYGMPTLVECGDIKETVAVAKKYGLDFIEINMSFPQYLPSALSIDKLKDITARDGIFYTIHADEMLNPFDFNPAVSKCYFGVIRDTIRFALALDVPVINMHLLKGVYVTLPEKVILLSDVYRDEYMTRVREFIAMCEEEIGDKDLKIAIENVDSNAFTKSQLEALESADPGLNPHSARYGLCDIEPGPLPLCALVSFHARGEDSGSGPEHPSDFILLLISARLPRSHGPQSANICSSP